ncbi:phosphopantetheine-binding protein [Streptomyces sp. NPDC006314]|uniref:acyl carrier protein n=1 Tax=Streptomyces sp. NPDC006314 TaxID=3154475 RepID=UPI0033A06FAC
MTAEQTAEGAALSSETVERELLGFLETKTKAALTPDQDMFASGLVSSMFAMELVVHLEQEYQVAIVGADLKLDNFRTVQRMTELVLRLQGASTTAGDA